jgi:hypothetical protein
MVGVIHELLLEDMIEMKANLVVSRPPSACQRGNEVPGVKIALIITVTRPSARNHIVFALRALARCAALSQPNVEERSCFELEAAARFCQANVSTWQKHFQFAPILRTLRLRN